MKRILLFCLCFLVLASSLWASDPTKIDWKLKFLLNDETLPFYPDTVRHTFVGNAMGYVSTQCKYAATAMDEAYVLPTGNNTSVAGFVNAGVRCITEILGVKVKDSDYGLLRIEKKDVGLDRISTEEGVKYWYVTEWGVNKPSLGVYNLATDSTPLEIYYSGIAGWDSCRAFRPCFENEAALYAFYLAKLRRGDTGAANFIKQIADNEIMDMKVILESRRPDITLEQKVWPR